MSKSKQPLDNSTVLESISDGVFSVDHDWKISSFNRAAEQITGIKRSDALGRYCSEVFRSSLCGEQCALRETLRTGKAIINKSCYFINSRGSKVPVTLSTAVLKDQQGNIIGGAETFRDLSEIEVLKKQLGKQSKYNFLSSHSHSMKPVISMVEAVADTSTTVLIYGETGTGKEVAAKALHQLSSRRRAPFIAVNCAALPENLLESTLFGHVKGAFTGAYENKLGYFARAENGTLFLDEIGDISPALQVRLLRVLQEREFEPVGSHKPQKTQVRIITATNKDLLELVSQGKFREDLYYRLNVIKITLPTLAQRHEDIPFLVAHFIERACVLSQNSYIQLSCFPFVNLLDTDPKKGETDLQGSLGSSREEMEKQMIIETLKNHHSKIAAAKALGIHKTTLFRKMKKYKIAF